MIYDVIIIGAGPAGISASIYAASRGLSTLVLEKKQVGGVIRGVSNVTHFAGVIEGETGKSFASKLYNQALNAGVIIKFEDVKGVSLEADIKEVVTNKNTHEAKCLIIANGTTPNYLNIPGEDKFNGNGVYYSLWDKIEEYKDREVFVVGGSDGAIKEALFVSTLARQVTVIHFEEDLGAIQEFKSKVENTDNIKIYLHSRLTKINGDNHIDSLEITDINTGEVKLIESPNSMVFIYAGSRPNSDLYEKIENENNYIVVNGQMETNMEGVYAVGDICKKQVRQIATAVSDGAIAGIQAAIYVKTK